MQATTEQTTRQRYIKLALLVIVAGNIYPIIYLRQNFEISILESFGISATQLGQLYAMLGIIYLLTYVPSGWLSDRVSPNKLMSFSLAMGGVLGIWFASSPSYTELLIIFGGWGITAGLTFWSALIKATSMLAQASEQGRFFGILEGGRGLVEALLASAALAIFTYYLGPSEDTATALSKVIWMYVSCMLLLAPITLWMLSDKSANTGLRESESHAKLVVELKTIASKPEVWLCAICILTGYQLFWATYSFSAFVQTEYQLSATAAASIGLARLWMRPLGAVAAGFAGDYLHLEKVLSALLLFCAAALLCLILLPAAAATGVLLAVVLLVSLLTFAIRGIFWSTLEGCKLSNKIKGLAIGCISLIGYSPDLYLPLLNGYLVDNYPGRQGYAMYYGFIAAGGIVGALSAWVLAKRVDAAEVIK